MKPGKYVFLTPNPWGEDIVGEVRWTGVAETQHLVNGAAMTEAQFAMWQSLSEEDARKFTHCDGKFGYYFFPIAVQNKQVLPVCKLEFKKVEGTKNLQRATQVRHWDWRRDAPTNPK
jgi:hypothetical protein